MVESLGVFKVYFKFVIQTRAGVQLKEGQVLFLFFSSPGTVVDKAESRSWSRGEFVSGSLFVLKVLVCFCNLKMRLSLLSSVL